LRTIAISAIGAYTIAAKIKGPLMPWIGFVFLMGHMSISHIDRQVRGDPAVVDITGKCFWLLIMNKTNDAQGTQMVMVMKVISI